MKAFVKTVLGESYLNSRIFNIQEVFSETNHLKLLIFILTAGNDPQEMIKRYTLDIGVNLKITSLGKGQGEKLKNS